MITKNEERYLEQCLRSVKDLVNEIILVDTGSSDRTVSIAQSFGAHVYSRPWDNDFSAPRNLSLAKATQSWILVLDADEVIDMSDHARLRQLAKDRSCCYALTQRHYTRETHLCNFRPVRGEFPRWEKDAAGYFDSNCVRFFPNGCGIEFRGVVHELAEHSIYEMKRHTIETPGILIHHFGHLKSRDQTSGKHELYTALGEKKTESEPASWKSFYEMAVQYQVNLDYTHSISAFQKCLELNPAHVDAWVNMAQVLGEAGRYAECAASLGKAISLSPGHNEAWCNLGVVHMRARNYEKAARCFFKAIEINPENVNAWTNLADTMQSLGHIQEALRGYERVLQLTPRNPVAKAGQVGCLLLLGQPSQAELAAQEGLRHDPQHPRLNYLLGQVYRLTDRAREAIQHLEKFCQLEAQNPKQPDLDAIAAARRDISQLLPKQNAAGEP